MIARSRAVAAPGGRLIELACQPPLTLRQIAAVRPGVCALCLVGTAAGPLAGDDLTLRLEVLAGTSASLQAAGAAIAQGRAGGAASSLRLQAALGTDAALRADPGALIVRAGARIAAHVEIDLGAHAQVEWHELIFLDARQTPREADRPAATLRWDVNREGVPLLRQLVDLTSAESLRDAFMFAGRRVLASALLSGRGVRGADDRRPPNSGRPAASRRRRLGHRARRRCRYRAAGGCRPLRPSPPRLRLSSARGAGLAAGGGNRRGGGQGSAMSTCLVAVRLPRAVPA